MTLSSKRLQTGLLTFALCALGIWSETNALAFALIVSCLAGYLAAKIAS